MKLVSRIYIIPAPGVAVFANRGLPLMPCTVGSGAVAVLKPTDGTASATATRAAEVALALAPTALLRLLYPRAVLPAWAFLITHRNKCFSSHPHSLPPSFAMSLNRSTRPQRPSADDPTAAPPVTRNAAPNVAQRPVARHEDLPVDLLDFDQDDVRLSDARSSCQ